MLKQPLGALGFAIVLGFILVVIFAPLLAPYSYEKQDIPHMLNGPSRTYLLGTDHLGRDLLSRLIYGSRIALGTAVPSVAIALVGGMLLGLISGYLGGFVDDVIIVFIDSIKAFPAVVLALAILAMLGAVADQRDHRDRAGLDSGLCSRGARPGNVPCARMSTSRPSSRWARPAPRIVLRHILPNILAPVLILAAMDLPVVITFEAGLSFLGMGVRPPTPSWGVILADGFKLHP